MTTKEEALKLADESQRQSSLVYLVADEPIAKQMSQMFLNYSAMIRRLVEELDKTQHDLKKYDELAFDDLFKRGKPVAWMSPDGKVSQTEGKLFHIPLYTTPKPLSDEEIKIIATQNRTDLTIPAYISFARLIEERHGIK